jgi:hypothetical protein
MYAQNGGSAACYFAEIFSMGHVCITSLLYYYDTTE